MEGVTGKNPTYHAGKTYNAAAWRIDEALALLDAQHHALGVDIGYLQRNDLGNAQTGTMSDAQRRLVLDGFYIALSRWLAGMWRPALHDPQEVFRQRFGNLDVFVILFLGNAKAIDQNKCTRLRRHGTRVGAGEKCDVARKAVQITVLIDRPRPVEVRRADEPAKTELVPLSDDRSRRRLQHRQERRQTRVLLDAHVEQQPFHHVVRRRHDPGAPKDGREKWMTGPPVLPRHRLEAGQPFIDMIITDREVERETPRQKILRSGRAD
jgi:hypothetical protein